MKGENPYYISGLPLFIFFCFSEHLVRIDKIKRIYENSSIPSVSYTHLLVEDWVVNGEWEKCERCGVLFDCQMHDSCTNCGYPVLTDKPWYVEKWHEEDLIAAMEKARAHITRENLDKMKAACKDIFEDKTSRNEMLEDKALSLIHIYNELMSILEKP